MSNLDCLQSAFCLKIRAVLISASATTNKDVTIDRASSAWVQLLVPTYSWSNFAKKHAT